MWLNIYIHSMEYINIYVYLNCATLGEEVIILSLASAFYLSSGKPWVHVLYLYLL